MQLKKRLTKIISLNLIFLLFGCAYYSMAGSIPPNIKNVSVPLFINEGDVIRVDTRTSEYVERVKSD